MKPKVGESILMLDGSVENVVAYLYRLLVSTIDKVVFDEFKPEDHDDKVFYVVDGHGWYSIVVKKSDTEYDWEEVEGLN